MFLPLLLISLSQTTLVYPPFAHTMGINRGTTAYLKIATGKSIEVMNPEGIWAVKFKFLDDPRTFRDDDELTVFAVNSGENQILYNVGLFSFGSYGKLGVRDSFLWEPTGISGDEYGNVFVVDKKNNRVVHLHFNGRKLIYVNSIGKFGILSGYFNGPSQASVSHGELYVTDTGNNRIEVFDTTGIFKREIKGFNHPTGIAVISSKDKWYKEKEDFIIVIDSYKKRISKLTPNGSLLARLSFAEIGLENSNFEYVAIDYYGMIYITDSYNNCIHLFDRNLKYITSFGREGKGKGEFIKPVGITIWRRFGQVFVLDKWSVQYFWIGLDAWMKDIRPSKFKSGNGLTIFYFNTEPGRTEIKIRDRNGNIVRRLYKSFFNPPGNHYVVWDGLDGKGEKLSPGKYTIEIDIKPLYSSRGFLKKHLTSEVECIQ